MLRGRKSCIDFAQLISAPVMTTLEGKSAFPEDHYLSLGTGSSTATGPVSHFLEKSDVVISIGSSLTRYGGGLARIIPPGKVIIQVTNDWRDVNKDYWIECPIIGDARLVLQQLILSIGNSLGEKGREDKSVKQEVKQESDKWLQAWMPKFSSNEVPLNPYRVIWDFIKNVDPARSIITHDSGSPRDMLVPFYKATSPRGYIGWGKSHALGAGLGLIIGAKLAQPEKFCANFMGDAAFGMTGLDFETAVRCNIPITTIVLNNSMMACEKRTLTISDEVVQDEVSGW